MATKKPDRRRETYRSTKTQMIRIIESKPKRGQDAIPATLIGEQFGAENYDKETGEISVYSKHFGGIIVLNRGEYLVIEKGKYK